MTFNDTEDKTLNINTEPEEEQLELNDEQIRAAALAYARYLRDNDLSPGESAEGEPEAAADEPAEAQTEAGEEIPQTKEPEEPEEAGESGQTEEKEEAQQDDSGDKDKKSEAQKAAALEMMRKREAAKARDREKFLKGGKDPFAAVMNVHDKAQDAVDRTFVNLGKEIITDAHRISSAYRNTRRSIGLAILVTGLLITGILIVFDIFTVYEYAYNGKVLGYVKNQEEVTDVLDVAGKQLTNNSTTEADVKFVANQNVTFNPVDGRGKSTDDSDTVVNKLIYMTDIETEAYAVYDGDKVVAIVKDQNDADSLLLQTKDDLSVPDNGMELVLSTCSLEAFRAMWQRRSR